jgi:DNA replication and repair protein RecF
MLPTVTFLPRDLDLFTGAPAERRRFLDQLLCQVSPPYIESLSTYQKVLKQRNALLKRIAQGMASVSDLEPWDIALSKEGAVITSIRLELIETFGLSLAAELQSLGESWRNIHFSYERATEETSCGVLASELQTRLAANRAKDVLLQSTTVGPHREDWMLLVEGHHLGEIGSRGQQRVAMLALLFLQASYLELRTGERPIVLLDDVCSELDDQHQERILEGLSGNQVILTGVQVPEGFTGEVKEMVKNTADVPQAQASGMMMEHHAR